MENIIEIVDETTPEVQKPVETVIEQTPAEDVTIQNNQQNQPAPQQNVVEQHKQVIENNGYVEAYKILVELGAIDLVPNVAVDGVETPIEKALTTRENLKAILTASLANKKAESDENSIDISQVPQELRPFIKVMAEGGDLQTALTGYSDTVNLQKVDVENNENDQQYIISLYHTKKGVLKQDEIVDLIHTYKAKGILAQKAAECYAEMNDIIQKEANTAIETKQAEKAKDIEDFKKYKTDLKNNLKETFNISDQKSQALVNAAYKETLNGYYIDSLYTQRMDDPKESANIIFFLMHPEEYIKVKSAEAIQDVKLSTTASLIEGKGNLKSISISSGGKQKPTPSGNNTVTDEEEITPVIEDDGSDVVII